MANDPAGKPSINLYAATSDHAKAIGIRDVMISISHCRAYAVAYALARGIEPALPA